MPSTLTTTFPDDAAMLATGGPTFRTGLVSSSNGQEQRNASGGVHPLHAFSIDFSNAPQTLAFQVADFVDDCVGSFKSFRFRDPFDYEAFAQPVVAVTGGYQLCRQYSAGGQYYYRPITRPRNPVSFDGGSAIDLDYETGFLTASSPPLSWSGEFDIEARVENDTIAETYQAVNMRGSRLRIRSVFDTPWLPVTNPVPTVIGSAGSPIFIPIEVGAVANYLRKTQTIAMPAGIEERFQEWSTINAHVEGDWLLSSYSERQNLLGLFYLTKGAQGGFWYQTTAGNRLSRFASDDLIFRRNVQGQSLESTIANLSMVMFNLPGVLMF